MMNSERVLGFLSLDCVLSEYTLLGLDVPAPKLLLDTFRDALSAYPELREKGRHKLDQHTLLSYREKLYEDTRARISNAMGDGAAKLFLCWTHEIYNGEGFWANPHWNAYRTVMSSWNSTYSSGRGDILEFRFPELVSGLWKFFSERVVRFKTPKVTELTTWDVDVLSNYGFQSTETNSLDAALEDVSNIADLTIRMHHFHSFWNVFRILLSNDEAQRLHAVALSEVNWKHWTRMPLIQPSQLRGTDFKRNCDQGIESDSARQLRAVSISPESSM